MYSPFFAFLSRMKYVDRWSLMRNTYPENLSTHSFEVAALSHLLALIAKRRFGKEIDPERAAVLGLYHDMPEILTGDLPTPVKYYNPVIKSAYAEVEKAASQKLLSALPQDLRKEMTPFFLPEKKDEALRPLVKAADKLCAYIKCREERRAGNAEFSKAEESTAEALRKMDLAEVQVFIDEFLPAFDLTLDQISDRTGDESHV